MFRYLKETVLLIMMGLSMIGYIQLSIVNTGYAKEQQESKQFQPNYFWSFKGFFGAYDLASVQRGYFAYREHCASCHSIKEMRYADLQQTGLTLEQIEKIASKDHILDGKDIQGNDHYRIATVKDFFPSSYVNEQVAKVNNSGQYPVDFSRYMLIGKNREDYMMALLLGYKDLSIGLTSDQITMHSHLIKDGKNASVEQQAKDIVSFLSWTAHPHLVERHRIGIMFSLYMIFVIVLLFLVKWKVWKRIS